MRNGMKGAGSAAGAAAKADKSQARFYDALRELFVGAPVEG